MTSNSARVGRRVRARRAPDRRLVDGDDLVELLEALDRAVGARPLRARCRRLATRLVEHLVDERRLARARHAGNAREHAERDMHVDVAAGCAGWPAGSPRSRVGLRRLARHRRSSASPERNWPVSDSLTRSTWRGGALCDDPAAVLAGPGPMSTRWSARAHRLLVVLDDDHRVAEVAQALERLDQLRVVALVQADRRLVEDVEHAHER